MEEKWDMDLCQLSRSINSDGAEYDKRKIHVTYRFRVCAVTQPRQLPTNHGTAQEQAPGTDKLRQNQALFRKYTAMGRAFRNKIATAVEPALHSA